jgi:hypothetical protein
MDVRGSPFATSEGGADVVTNASCWKKLKTVTGDIDLRHLKVFDERSLNPIWEGN